LPGGKSREREELSQEGGASPEYRRYVNPRDKRKGFNDQKGGFGQFGGMGEVQQKNERDTGIRLKMVGLLGKRPQKGFIASVGRPGGWWAATKGS